MSSPHFATDGLVYAYATMATGNEVFRMRLIGNRLSAPRSILRGIEKGPIHNGGRIKFVTSFFTAIGLFPDKTYDATAFKPYYGPLPDRKKLEVARKVKPLRELIKGTQYEGVSYTNQSSATSTS